MFFLTRLPQMLATLLLLTINISVSAICVWPDGNPASKTDLGECSGDGKNMCCAPGDSCLRNGLCGGPNSVFYRGGCTDGSWFRDSCPTFCTDGNSENTTAQVSRCSEGKLSEERWVCGDSLDPCDDDQLAFKLDDDLSVLGTVARLPVESAKVLSTQESSTQPSVTHASPTQASATKASSAAQTASSPKASSAHVSSTEASSSPSPAEAPQSATKSPLPLPASELATSPLAITPLPTNLQPADTPQQPTPTPLLIPATPPPPPPPSPQEIDSNKKLVSIGIGVGVGASVMIAGSILLFCFGRKRHLQRNRSGPVRAETPPPLEDPPRGREESHIDKPGFRAGSTRTRNQYSSAAPETTTIPMPMMRMMKTPMTNESNVMNERNYTPYRPGPGPGMMTRNNTSASLQGGRVIPVDGFTAALPGVHRVQTQRGGQGQGQGPGQCRERRTEQGNGNGVYEMA